MQIDSIFLSLFFTTFLLLEILVYKHMRFDFLEQGQDINLSLKNAVIIFTLVAVIIGGLSYFVLTTSGPQLLQLFYIYLFTFSFALTLIFLIPLRNIYRILLSLLISFSCLGLLLKFDSQFLQNVFMAVSILWVGPVIIKKFKLPLRYLLLFIIIFTAIDIYNIYFTKTSVLFSDGFFFLNALVTFGDYSLGIGDFFFGYVVISATIRYFGLRSAIILAVLLTLPRLLIRVLFPQLAGTIFPYTMFMTPIIFLVYSWSHYLSRKTKNRLSAYAESSADR